MWRDVGQSGVRRVAVTGLGLVTPLGVGVEHVWSRLLRSESGIGPIDRFNVDDLPCRIAGLVPTGSFDSGGFDPSEWIGSKDQRKMDRFARYAMCAASQALDDSGWRPQTDRERERTGVLVGSGIGGLPGIAEAAVALHERGARAVSPFFVPSNLINLAAGHIAIAHGLRGPTHAVATACASGAHALGDAARMIMFGDADVMVAGGAEAAVCRIGIAGFCAARALSTSFNDDPRAASRPWDRRRDGFVMGEGSGMVVLEEYEHAMRRSARIYAELAGYGLSGDGFHIAAPPEDGNGAVRAMSAAIGRAGITPDAIDYVNAHATSTQAGDEIELRAIETVFGTHATGSLSVSSTKSAMGHLLGASGAVEAIISILALRDQIAPPTLNLNDPPDDCPAMDLVANTAKPRRIGFALSNSFGFGGTNAALVFAGPH
ncbi:beta-ketoacyl-ACP synthase II [Paraburkholderia sp. CNPSo 3157]|uniref:3-oxoacyl-[acyl-carrier-protein] synthase 2 n=2 Tax=Paraburkholderia franconis TaxID=2654983 RepID=A0A7X1TK16_9BURK|nr:beta-ketoacyl-ACP synthase II [Paraburkholderia franconis]MPW22257.1 beta-ketoacyl-ACP synthase II [Paraburkholderia franconis]